MKPIEHGTDRGYQAHRRRGVRVCMACADSHAAYEQERRSRAVAPRELIPCGEPSAYRRHIRRGEEACSKCLAAHAADVARYSQKRGAA